VRQAPARTCVACRTRRDKAALLRIVRRPDGEVVLDESGRLDGRGAYVCAEDGCRAAAIRRSALQRALRTPLPAELRARLEHGAVAVGRTTTGRPVPQVMLGGPDGT